MTDSKTVPASSKGKVIIGSRFDGALPKMSRSDELIQLALLNAAKPGSHSAARKVLDSIRSLLRFLTQRSAP